MSIQNSARSALSEDSSLQEIRQINTLPINEHILKSPTSNLDELDVASYVRKPATVSDPQNVARPARVRNTGLIVVNNNSNRLKSAPLNNNNNAEYMTAGTNIGTNSKTNNSISLDKQTEMLMGYKEKQIAVDEKHSSSDGFQEPKSLKDLFVNNAIKMKDTIKEFTNTNTQRLSETIRRHYSNNNNNIPPSTSHARENTTSTTERNDQVPSLPNFQPNNFNPANSTNEIPQRSHQRSYPRTSPQSHIYYQPNYRYEPTTQNILADVINPSVVGQTNVRFVTTEERDRRDRQVTNSLGMIAQSLEQPVHYTDVATNWLLDSLRIEGLPEEMQPWYYKTVNFLVGYPFSILRTIWHYTILEINFIYNLTLLFVSFYRTPPVSAFVIGISLFWIKILYELYRDILHRDDALYQSNVPREMSLAAAISASMGFILKMKAQEGDITDAWWRGEEE